MNKTTFDTRMESVLEDLADYHEHRFDDMWLASNGEFTVEDAKAQLRTLVNDVCSEVIPADDDHSHITRNYCLDCAKRDGYNQALRKVRTKLATILEGSE